MLLELAIRFKKKAKMHPISLFQASGTRGTGKGVMEAAAKQAVSHPQTHVRVRELWRPRQLR